MREVRSIMKTTGIWWSNPEGLVQNRTARFSTDRRRHLVSLITMLGPSPDWCVGEVFASVITFSSCHLSHCLLIFTFGFWHEPSVCRLSVTLLRPTQRVDVWGNIFAPPISLGTWSVCVKILEKKLRGFSCKLNGRRYEKLVFS